MMTTYIHNNIGASATGNRYCAPFFRSVFIDDGTGSHLNLECFEEIHLERCWRCVCCWHNQEHRFECGCGEIKNEIGYAYAVQWSKYFHLRSTNFTIPFDIHWQFLFYFLLFIFCIWNIVFCVDRKNKTVIATTSEYGLRNTQANALGAKLNE